MGCREIEAHGKYLQKWYWSTLYSLPNKLSHGYCLIDYTESISLLSLFSHSTTEGHLYYILFWLNELLAERNIDQNQKRQREKK